MAKAAEIARKLQEYEQDAYDGEYGDSWLEEIGEGLRFYAEYCAVHSLTMTMTGFIKYVDGLHNGEVHAFNIPAGFFDEKARKGGKADG